jgi:DNA-binding GntR family transcriptional regulator
MVKLKKTRGRALRRTPENLVTQAYTGIRRMLFLNEIAPGQKLHYRELAEQLGMSPTPVIQALKWLEFQGLVHHETNRGFYMEPISLEEVREIYELRESLELGLLPKALANLDDDGIQRLRSAHEGYLTVSTNPYLKQRLLKDMEFHLRLAALSECRITERILRHLFDLLYLKYKAEILFSRPMEDVGSEHQKIFDRVAARDVRGSSRALAQHLQTVRDHVIENIQQGLEEKETLQF